MDEAKLGHPPEQLAMLLGGTALKQTQSCSLAYDLPCGDIRIMRVDDPAIQEF